MIFALKIGKKLVKRSDKLHIEICLLVSLISQGSENYICMKITCMQLYNCHKLKTIPRHKIAVVFYDRDIQRYVKNNI